MWRGEPKCSPNHLSILQTHFRFINKLIQLNDSKCPALMSALFLMKNCYRSLECHQFFAEVLTMWRLVFKLFSSELEKKSAYNLDIGIVPRNPSGLTGQTSPKFFFWQLFVMLEEEIWKFSFFQTHCGPQVKLSMPHILLQTRFITSA